MYKKIIMIISLIQEKTKKNTVDNYLLFFNSLSNTFYDY